MFRVVIGINGLGLQYIMKMKKAILALLLAGASASAFAVSSEVNTVIPSNIA